MIFAGLKQRVTPFDNPVARFIAGRFGVWLFLVSLGMLFGATLVGFVVIRVNLHDVWPRDLPVLPSLLLMSTATLGLSSLTLQWALNGIHKGYRERLKVGVWMTTILGFVFLALQTMSWWSWLDVVMPRWDESNEYRFALSSFYVMTGLHAVHVVGGLIPMLIVSIRASMGRYKADDCAGVTYATMYWHFLGVVWLALYGTLLVGT